MFSYNEAVNVLVKRFGDKITNLEAEEYRDLPTVFYEHYFVPYIKNEFTEEMLRNPSEKNTKHTKKSSKSEKIEEIFIFLEEMAESEDAEVKNLLQVSVLEALYIDESIRNELKKYMGFETEKIYNDVLKYFG